MGKHQAQRKIFSLQFEEPEFKTIEIRVKSVSAGRLLAVADEAKALKDGAGLEMVRGLLTLFIARVVTWNLQHEVEDDADPEEWTNADGSGFVDTPITVDGLLLHELDLVLAVVLAWFDAMVTVSDPLDESSTSGPRYPEELIGMAAL